MFALIVANLATGKEIVFISTANSTLSKLDKRTQKKTTSKLCQDKVGQSFKIPASQKSLSDILGL